MSFEGLTDEELCVLVKKGDVEAESFLLNKYKNLVKSRAKTLYLLGGDRDDLIQEGMIGLFMAVRSYDGERGAAFQTFARLMCERRMYNAIKAWNSGKNIPLNTYISLYATLNGGEGDEDAKLVNSLTSGVLNEPEDLVIERENTDTLIENLRSRLSEFENEVFTLYLKGKNYTEIAKELKKEPKTADNALQRIKKKLKDVMKKDK